MKLRAREVIIAGAVLVLAVVSFATVSTPRVSLGAQHDRQRGAHLGVAACSVAAIPTLLTTDKGYRLYVETPQILRNEKSGSVLLVGSPAFALNARGEPWIDSAGSAPTMEMVGGALSTTGQLRLIPAPLGGAHPGVPRGVVDSAEALHLIWAPFDSTSHTPRDSMVEWATYAGGRWSPARRLPEIRRDSWAVLRVSPVASLAGKPSVVVSGMILPDSDLAVQWTGGEWQVKHQPVASSLYVTVATVDDTTRVMGFVGGGNPDGNTLWSRRSVNRGESWPESTLVSMPGTGAAYDPYVVALGANRVAIAWLARRRGGGATVRIAMSSDGGRTWHEADPIPAPASNVMRVAGTPNGVLHMIVAETGENGMPRMHYRAWHNGQWSAEWLPSDSLVGFGTPSMEAIGRDSVFAVWGTQKPGTGFETVASMAVVFRTTCNDNESAGP